jgi:hypothetical protein
LESLSTRLASAASVVRLHSPPPNFPSKKLVFFRSSASSPIFRLMSFYTLGGSPVYSHSLPIFHCRIWKYLGPKTSIHRRGRKARQFRSEKDDPRGFLNRPERGKAQTTDAHCDEGPLAIHFRALVGRGSYYRLFNHTYSQNKAITTMATINIVRSALFISNTL